MNCLRKVLELSFVVHVLGPLANCAGIPATVSVQRITSTTVVTSAAASTIGRRLLGQNTCGRGFTCASDQTCTTNPGGYVGCCGSAANNACSVHTVCYTSGFLPSVAGRRPGELICPSTAPDCGILSWTDPARSKYVTAFTCVPVKTASSTIVVGSSTYEFTEHFPTTKHLPTTVFPTATTTLNAEPTKTTSATTTPDSPKPPPGSGIMQDLTKSQQVGASTGCAAVALMFLSSIAYCACWPTRRRRRPGPGTVDAGQPEMQKSQGANASPEITEFTDDSSPAGSVTAATVRQGGTGTSIVGHGMPSRVTTI